MRGDCDASDWARPKGRFIYNIVPNVAFKFEI